MNRNKVQNGETKALSPASKKTLIACAAVALAIVLTLAIVLPLVLKVKDLGLFKVPDNLLPTEEKYALNKYYYENLSDSQVTLRADAMKVTKRNLPRAQTELLSDDFSLIYNTEDKSLTTAYGELVQSTDKKKTATIRFGDYPSPSHEVSGANAFTYGVMNGKATTDSNFYKYMLMTQGQHLAAEASKRSANGTLTQEWLKKHPSADAQYGAVLGENNAVEKEIILDPLYRSPHVTGLYLPAGELVTVKVEGLAEGERLSVALGMQNSLAWRGSVDENAFKSIAGNVNQVNIASSDAFFTKADVLTANGIFSGSYIQSQWKRQNTRAPWLTADFIFNGNGEYKIGTPFGGVIHLGMQNCYSRAKVTFTGAVETPHYILGVTAPEYFDEYLRQAPGVIAVLDTENGQLIGPTGEMGTTSYMRQVKTDEIDKLAMLWHSFLSVNESFTGGPYNRFNKVMFDQHVPAGAAVSLGNYSFAHPTGWFNGAMNYRGLLRGGTWGILHEIGHNHAASYGTIWGFAGSQEGEVRNNALILLNYIMFCDIGTTIRSGGGAEHGEYANPYSTLSETLTLKGKLADFNNAGYFQALGMYSNIMHSFGAEKYYELLYTYKKQAAYCANKRADFAYRCSLIYGMNFVKYFNEFYSAKITDEMFDAEQLGNMSSLPNYEPVSGFYSGGIDGVKTAGDYCVTFGNPIEFDLLGNTVSTLDTADKKGFEIIDVEYPEHGKLKNLGEGRWEYSFNENYSGTFDEFSYIVKLNDGIVHKLTVYLRINYNGAKLTTYQGFEQLDRNDIWNKADEVMASVEGKVTSISNSGIPNYNSGKADEIRVIEYLWKAPVSGEVQISTKHDDYSRVYFGETFDSLTQILEFNGYSNNYPTEGNATVTVKKGNIYAIRAVNINAGGQGGMTVGVKYDGDENFSYIPVDQIYHPDLKSKDEIKPFVYEPQYMISKKDSVNLSSTGTDKSQWQVVQAPENIVGGRYEEQQQIDPVTGEIGGVMTTDKWTYLIDGMTNTVMHTTYGGGVPQINGSNPHVFVVDTAKIQQFNYFSITTRNNANSYITDFEIQIADTLESEWKTVCTGDRNSYKGTRIMMQVPQVTGRYIRIVVKGTTGGNFSVLAEIDAGIMSQTQRVVPPTSSKLFATKGWKNSKTIEGETSGYLIANKKNQKLVAKFKGTSFALYAYTGENFGSFKVKIDGKYVSTVNLQSQIEESRKLVFNAQDLQDKEHTVEIITLNSNKIMLNVLGLSYTSELLNASNIYLERGLGITLAVFIALFAAVFAFVIVLMCKPSFRDKVFASRVVKSMENSAAKPKKERSNVKKGKVNDSVSQKMEDIAAKNKPAKSEQTETKPVEKVKVSGNSAAKEKNLKQGKVDDSVAKKMADINAKSKDKSKDEPAAKKQTKTSSDVPKSKKK